MQRVHGKVRLILSIEPKKSYDVKNCLVVKPYFEERYKEFLNDAAGIILQNRPDDSRSEEMARRVSHDLKIPLLIRADAATTILKEDQMITLDPSKGLIFEGIVETHDDMLSQVCDI